MTAAPSITFDEANAVRIIGGWIVRSLAPKRRAKQTDVVTNMTGRRRTLAAWSRSWSCSSVIVQPSDRGFFSKEEIGFDVNRVDSSHIFLKIEEVL